MLLSSLTCFEKNKPIPLSPCFAFLQPLDEECNHVDGIGKQYGEEYGVLPVTNALVCKGAVGTKSSFVHPAQPAPQQVQRRSGQDGRDSQAAFHRTLIERAPDDDG